LNLFLVAIIGGHLFRHRGYDVGTGSPSLPRILANAQASLSPSDAATFGAVMRRDAARYVESARELADARAALERQIMAEPYDAAATKQAFNAWQTSGSRFLSDVSDPLIEALGKVSQEGRQKLVASRRKSQPGLRVP
jgi:succinate dehydrogenase/fumarate reductase flavoprotein subunit